MRPYKVSIITPSFQQGNFIERTIQSVLAQNIPNLEYFIFDGGSQDQTISLLQQYQAHLSWTTERDKGQAHAVNKGFKKASGDIIGWLNSDDIYYPNAISEVCKYFAAHPDVDVIYGEANHIDEADAFIERYPTESWSIERLKSTCFLSQPAVFFRRSVLEKYGLLDEKLHFCMDYEYWIRIALAGANFSYLPLLLAGSRLHNQTKTISAPLNAYSEAVMMLKHKFNYVPIAWLVNYSIAKIKTKPHKRLSQLRYVFNVWLVSSYSILRHNGCRQGLMDLIKLPVHLLRMRRISRFS